MGYGIAYLKRDLVFQKRDLVSMLKSKRDLVSETRFETSALGPMYFLCVIKVPVSFWVSYVVLLDRGKPFLIMFGQNEYMNVVQLV